MTVSLLGRDIRAATILVSLTVSRGMYGVARMFHVRCLGLANVETYHAKTMPFSTRATRQGSGPVSTRQHESIAGKWPSRRARPIYFRSVLWAARLLGLERSHHSHVHVIVNKPSPCGRGLFKVELVGIFAFTRLA